MLEKNLREGIKSEKCYKMINTLRLFFPRVLFSGSLQASLGLTGLVTLFIVMTKGWTKSETKWERFVSPHCLRIQPTLVEKMWSGGQSMRAAAFVTHCSPEAEGDECRFLRQTLLPFSFSLQSGTPVHEMMPPTLRNIFLTVKPTWNALTDMCLLAES